jgi:hypothetical protein
MWAVGAADQGKSWQQPLPDFKAVVPVATGDNAADALTFAAWQREMSDHGEEVFDRANALFEEQSAGLNMEAAKRASLEMRRRIREVDNAVRDAFPALTTLVLWCKGLNAPSAPNSRASSHVSRTSCRSAWRPTLRLCAPSVACGGT